MRSTVWATFLPILVFLIVYVLDLWINICQMDRVTLRPNWPLTLEVMALVGDTGLRAPMVHQDFISYAFQLQEDMTHFRSHN